MYGTLKIVLPPQRVGATIMCGPSQVGNFALFFFLSYPPPLACSLRVPSLPFRRRQVRGLRLLRQPAHPRPRLRRVQLRQLRGPVRRLWEPRRHGRLLLPRVRPAGEGPGRLPEDRQPGGHQDGPLLRTEEVRLQEEVAHGSPHLCYHYCCVQGTSTGIRYILCLSVIDGVLGYNTEIGAALRLENDVWLSRGT
jgi:hypothetical protein